MYVNLLIRYKKTILTFWCLLILSFGLVLISRLSSNAPAIDNSVGIWFQTDDKELVRYQHYNQDFGKREWTLLMLQTKSIYDPTFMRALAKITARIERLPHIVKVTSIANVRDNFVTKEDELEYRKIYSPPKKTSAINTSTLLSPTELQQVRTKLLANPVFENSLLRSADDRHTVLLIQNDNLIYDPQPYRIELVDNIKAILAQYPIVESHALAGTTVVNAELNRSAKRDVYVYYTLISLLLIVFGWLNFRNLKDLIAMFAVVLGSVIPSMGLIAFWDIPYNMITVMLPTILVSLGVAGVVHVINEFHGLHQRIPAEVAVRNTVKQLWKPGLYAAATTIFGFASLTASSVVPVYQLGLYAGIGIFLAWITSLSISPLLLYWLWKTPKFVNGPDKPPLVFTYGAKLLACARYKAVKWLIFAALVLPLIGLVWLETDTNYTKFFADSTAVSRAYADLKRAGFAQNPISVVIEYPRGGRYSDEKYFRPVLDFEQQLKKHPGVIKVISANELVRQVDKAFNEGHTSDAVFRQYNSAQIDQLLFLAELSGNDDLDDLLLKDKSKTQMLVLTPYMSSKELDAFRGELQKLKVRYLPTDLRLYTTGTTVLWANMDKHVSKTQLFSLLLVSVFLLTVFIGVFRSPRFILVALLVNALPLAITLGLMGWLGGKINIATALIGGISLGVVVDDTIHLFTRIKQFLRQGMSMPEAIDKAVDHVGKSIVNTSVIIAGGFASLATSDYLPTAQFGVFVTIAILIAMLMDLYLSPWLLKVLCHQPKQSAEFVSEFSEL